MIQAIKALPLRKYDDVVEKALFISLCGLAVSFFFSAWGVSRFSIWSLYILLVWRFLIGHERVRSLPKSLLLFAAFYILSFIISAFLSENKSLIVAAFKDHRVFFLAGLLFIAPLSDRLRKYALILFFISAIFGGLIGTMQYFALFPNTIPYQRPQGLGENSIIYATQLALACGIGILIFVFKEVDLVKAKKELFLVLITIAFTLLGILFSQSRGVWLALFAACSVSLFFYDRLKAAIFLFFTIATLILIFASNGPLKHRAVSIAASVVNPQTDPDSTGIRLKLWKGSLLIFQESPMLGTGVGDFRSDINRLIHTKKIDEILDPPRGNAHSTFFHTLATQGIVGIFLLLGLYTSVISFAIREIRTTVGPGGYIILLMTIVLIVGGLTVPYLGGIGMNVVLAEYCFLFGLLGPYGSLKKELKEL